MHPQELRKQCQNFATALLDHTRTSFELEVLLNHDPAGPPHEHGERMHLNRLKLAIKLKQKKVGWLICTSLVPHLHLISTSHAPRIRLTCTSLAPHMYLTCTSVTPHMHHGYASHAPYMFFFFKLPLYSGIEVWEGLRRMGSAINPVVCISASER